jgi:hypothetical protein
MWLRTLDDMDGVTDDVGIDILSYAPWPPYFCTIPPKRIHRRRGRDVAGFCISRWHCLFFAGPSYDTATVHKTKPQHDGPQQWSSEDIWSPEVYFLFLEQVTLGHIDTRALASAAQVFCAVERARVRETASVTKP